MGFLHFLSGMLGFTYVIISLTMDSSFRRVGWTKNVAIDGLLIILFTIMSMCNIVMTLYLQEHG